MRKIGRSEESARWTRWAGSVLALLLVRCAGLDAGGTGSQGPAQVLPADSTGVPAANGTAGASLGGAAGPFGGSGRGATGTPGALGGSGMGPSAAGMGGSAGMARRGSSGAGGAVSVGSGGGISGAAGVGGGAGRAGAGGATIGAAGAGAGGTSGGNPEPGRLAGITAAQNAVRAMVQTTTPLPPLVWSQAIADYAQQWADMLAQTCIPQHRSSAELQSKGYGENLAAFGSFPVPPMSTVAQAVNGWAGEVACWQFGQFMRTDSCNASCIAQMNSDGCGHYTQIVWRKTTQVGCGVSSCMRGNQMLDIWICNYSAAGNAVGQNPY